MKKLSYPPFLTLLATILATFVNKVFGITVDIDMAIGAMAVVGNYLLVQFAVDIQRLKRGEMPKTQFNSVKFYTTLLVWAALGVSNYFKLDFSPELITAWASIAMTIITGKGIADMTQNKKEASNETNHIDADRV